VYGSFEKLWSGPVGIFPAKWIHATHIAIVLRDWKSNFDSILYASCILDIYNIGAMQMASMLPQDLNVRTE
jgi:hypothetical protein